MAAMLDGRIARRPRPREDLTVRVPPANELLERLASLPAARPLLARLSAETDVYVVGGAVRDLLRGDEPTELDLVVEGDAQALARRLGGAVRVYDRFGTCTVTLDGFSYDMARARRERYPFPGALPEVSPATLPEDLGRRDFTVNAIAMALGGERAGELVAAPQALADLEAAKLRVLHDGSFRDDPTRLLRMARYASRLRFAIEPGTADLAREAVDRGALRTVSGARVGRELRLLAREPDPVAALGALAEFRVDAAIAPRFGLHDASLARKALALLAEHGRRDRLALALAVRPIPASRIAALLDQLAFEAADRDAIELAATRADALARELARAERPSEITAAVKRAGGTAELVALAGALGPENMARLWLNELRHVGLEINGNDLLDAGIPPGPAVGRGLSAALAAKLDGRAEDREAELAEAVRAARATG